MPHQNFYHIFVPAAIRVKLRFITSPLKRIAIFAQVCRDYLSDAMRYYKWSHNGRRDKEIKQREFALLKAYHSIEKGLSLSTPRPGFGEEKIKSFLSDIKSLQEGGSRVSDPALASLLAYSRFNSARDTPTPWLDNFLKKVSVPTDLSSGGTISIRKSDIQSAARSADIKFFTSRHSIRHFGSEEVPLSTIEEAVRIAQKSPSVCNRQGAKVYCFNPATVALSHQKGNGGFGENASKGLVVTADLQAFSSAGERHQAYVDGGIFAMSLVYGLHLQGAGSCMLAWSSRAHVEKKLRTDLNIPESEVVIMMIAVGSLPDSLNVARAWRRPLEDVLIVRH